MQEYEMIICPKCRSIVPTKWGKCPRCDAVLSQSSAGKQTPKMKTSVKWRISANSIKTQWTIMASAVMILPFA